MIDYLPSDEIYDYDTEEKERTNEEIEALERKERVENERDEIIERQVDDEIERKEREAYERESIRRKLKEEIMIIKLMTENLKKIYELLELPNETNKQI